MKKEYLTPDLTIVEVQLGHLLGVSGESVPEEPELPDIPSIPGLDLGFGGIDIAGIQVPM